MKYALTCLAGLMALGLVGLAPDTASAAVTTMAAGGAALGLASMSARATVTAAMAMATVVITIATAMGTAPGGGTVTAIGTSG